MKRSFTEACEGNIVFRGLHKLISALITALLMATAGLVFFIVLMRYVFHTNIYGADEIVTLITMWLYFLGAVYGSYEESHIQGDLLNLMFTKRVHYKIHKLYVYTFCVFLMGIWSYWGVDYARTCLASPRATTGLKIPFWCNQLPIAVGMWGMLFYSLYHLIENIVKKPSEYLTREEKALGLQPGELQKQEPEQKEGTEQ